MPNLSPTSNPLSALHRALLLAVSLPTVHVADAAEPQRCATIHEDQSRLACYDAVFGAPAVPAPSPAAAPAIAAGALAASAAAAAPTTAPAPAPATDRPDDFGFEPAQIRRNAAGTEAAPAVSQDLTATLRSLTRRVTGEYVYALDNGQKWAQVEADSEGKLAPGATLTIGKASLGSYKLRSGSVSTRVRRVE